MASIMQFGTPIQRRLTKMYTDTKSSLDFVSKPAVDEDDELKKLHRKLRIQKDRLTTWGLRWSEAAERKTDTASGTPPPAYDDIDESLSRAGLADVVGSIMGTIKDILAEAEPLWKASGARNTTYSARAAEKAAEAKMPLMQWDKRRFEDLVKDLTSSIDTLYDISRMRHGEPQKAQSKKKIELLVKPEKAFEKARMETPQAIDPKRLRNSTGAPVVYVNDDGIETLNVEGGKQILYLWKDNTTSEITEPTPVLVEFATYDPLYSFTGIGPPMTRFEKLFNALQRDEESLEKADFGSLKLIGYFEENRNSRFTLVYELPSRLSIGVPLGPLKTRTPAPYYARLADVLSHRSLEPPLEVKYRLAYNLATSVFDLHSRGVVHGNLALSTITFFENHAPQTPLSQLLTKPLTESEKLLLELRDLDPPLNWKDTATEYYRRTGKDMKVPALQMMCSRARQKIVPFGRLLAEEIPHSKTDDWLSSVDLRRPYLTSYDLFPEPASADGPTLKEPANITWYRHRLDPRLTAATPFTAENQLLDLHALALLLMDIGLWQSSQEMRHGITTSSIVINVKEDPAAVYKLLAARCGTSYRNAFRACFEAVDSKAAVPQAYQSGRADVHLQKVYGKVLSCLEKCCSIEETEDVADEDDYSSTARPTPSAALYGPITSAGQLYNSRDFNDQYPTRSPITFSSEQSAFANVCRGKTSEQDISSHLERAPKQEPRQEAQNIKRHHGKRIVPHEASRMPPTETTWLDQQSKSPESPSQLMHPDTPFESEPGQSLSSGITPKLSLGGFIGRRRNRDGDGSAFAQPDIEYHQTSSVKLPEEAPTSRLQSRRPSSSRRDTSRSDDDYEDSSFYGADWKSNPTTISRRTKASRSQADLSGPADSDSDVDMEDSPMEVAQPSAKLNPLAGVPTADDLAALCRELESGVDDAWVSQELAPLTDHHLSGAEISVTSLLIRTKQLLETLTQWTRREAVESELLDAHKRLESELNATCSAFTAVNVDTADFNKVPAQLRVALNSALATGPSQQTLDSALPEMRDILIAMIHKLKRKQEKLHQDLSIFPNADNADITAPLNEFTSKIGGAQSRLSEELRANLDLMASEATGLPSQGHHLDEHSKPTTYDGEVSEGSRKLRRRVIGEPKTKKEKLSKALQKANTAVALDNARIVEGALVAYQGACSLLQDVIAESLEDSEKKKLEDIQKTYKARITELEEVLPVDDDMKDAPTRRTRVQFQEPPSPWLWKTRSPEATASQDVGKVVTVSSAFLRGVLRKPTLNCLILDLRVPRLYAHSRIRGALNVCVTASLLAQPSFDLPKLVATFKTAEERARILRWQDYEYIFVYDTEHKEEDPATFNTIKKFTEAGWSGRAGILMGGFEAFVQVKDDLVDWTLPHSMQSVDDDFDVHSNASDKAAMESIEEIDRGIERVRKHLDDLYQLADENMPDHHEEHRVDQELNSLRRQRRIAVMHLSQKEKREPQSLTHHAITQLSEDPAADHGASSGNGLSLTKSKVSTKAASSDPLPGRHVPQSRSSEADLTPASSLVNSLAVAENSQTVPKGRWVKRKPVGGAEESAEPAEATETESPTNNEPESEAGPSEKPRRFPTMQIMQEHLDNWHKFLMPQINEALRSFYRKYPESVEISLETIGESPQKAKPTILVICQSVGKVKSVLKRRFNYDAATYGLMVCKGKIVRSGARKRRPRRSMFHGDDNYWEPKNIHHQQRPLNGASIGAYCEKQYLSPVSFGGMLMIDGEPFGMSVHHMLDVPSEDEYDEDDSSVPTIRSSENDSFLFQAPRVPDAPEYGYELSEYDSDTASYYSSDDESMMSEPELEPGDIGGIAPEDVKDDYLITQPAFDDVGNDYFRDTEHMDEYLGKYIVGKLHASSGLRRRECALHLTHEIDWALFRFNEERMPTGNHIKGASTYCSATSEYPVSCVPFTELAGLKVHAIGRTTGLTGGFILPALASVKIKGRQTPAQSYMIAGGLGVPGDSGAWVMENEEGRACGHVLAWSDRKQVAYFSPMEIMLQDIKTTLRAESVGFPTSKIGSGRVLEEEEYVTVDSHEADVMSSPSSTSSGRARKSSTSRSQSKRVKHSPGLTARMKERGGDLDIVSGMEGICLPGGLVLQSSAL